MILWLRRANPSKSLIVVVGLALNCQTSNSGAFKELEKKILAEEFDRAMYIQIGRSYGRKFYSL
jgi:hypothetical protein